MKKILLLAATIFCFSNLINAQAGQLDPTFGNHGTVTTDFGNATTFKTIAFQKDGKIIAAGNYAVARYNTDGSLDNTFSDDGKLTPDSAYEIRSVTIQSDGKIIAAGAYAISRYNIDGSLDNTFSDDGKVNTNPTNYITSVTVQATGKIVVAGGQYNETGGTSYPTIAQYNSDGSLDKTFGVNGKQTIDLGGDAGAFRSVTIQNDGKIVAAGIFGDPNYPYPENSIIVSRFNTNGSIDSSFGRDGRSSYFAGATSADLIVQNDGKIVAGGSGSEHDNGHTDIIRFNANGSIDSSLIVHKSFYYKYPENTSLALQDDGKIVVLGVDFFRLNTDGSVDSSFNINAGQEVDFAINHIAIANSKLYAAGGGQYGAIARYLLDNGNNTLPTVSLTTPTNNTTYLAPAYFWLRAAASDANGTISKVEFYNSTYLLHTEYVTPYGFKIRDLPVGNYTFTAKAYDNSGLVTTSAPVHISVVPNKPPVVSITKPVVKQTVAAPGYIHFEAAASDSDGRITNVKFYNGSTLLRTEYKYPYTYVWKDVPEGTYTITAVATDNWGAWTTSATVTITVTSADAMIVSKKPANDKMPVSDAVNLKLYPNPATNIVNIFTKGLQSGEPATISVISPSGFLMKTVQTRGSTQTQLDVSTLAKGVYTIKIISGDKILYKQFVKV